MNIVFMGTPVFAATALKAILNSSHKVSAVYTQAPKPAHRGHKIQKSPVHELAESHGLPVFTPKSLREETLPACDVAVVAAYGLILPRHILDAPEFGCLNIHASLLPRWRGAAPIQRAIEAGDQKTGITIMQMEAGLDTGPMILKKEVSIDPQDTASTLHDKLMILGAEMIVKALEQLESLTPTPQPEEGVTYAKKLEKSEGKLNWHEPAESLDRKIRAFTPWPGCYVESGGEQIKILKAHVTDGTGTPGQKIAAPIVIACAQGALSLDVLQRPGKKPLTASEFIKGFRLDESL